MIAARYAIKINTFILFILMPYAAVFNVVFAEIIPDSQYKSECAPIGNWRVPGGREIAREKVISNAANQSVVLLGEAHANLEHHRWQLQILTSLHARNPDMVIGFEMFPRRVQGALDKWVAGSLSVSEFLDASDWKNGWSINAKAYLPLFHFARMNKIPMVALNIDSQLRKEVSLKGFDILSEERFKGITRPAEPSNAYLEYLKFIYKKHDRNYKNHDDESDFQRFVRGQQLWDRAMAQAIHSALIQPKASPGVGIEALFSALIQPKPPLVVGIMGVGHIRYGYGVPRQLKDLGIMDIAMLLPWENNKSCGKTVVGIADAVFSVAPYTKKRVEKRQRLGIRFEMVQKGARILKVEEGSIAELAGLIDKDIIIEVAGLEVKKINDVIKVVQRQAPGTWLPLKIIRGEELITIIAKFSAVGQ
tara:strand:+ start:4473 stop:5732 length:1260 start_codon:yes stop_codon:yes gene_type:complete